MSKFATQYASLQIIEALTSGAVLVPPAQMYVALYTVPPGVTSLGTELVGGDYARQPLYSNTPVAGTTGRTGQATSSGGILFTNLPVASGDLLGLALCDAPTAGNIWLVNDAWTHTGTAFAIGGNLLIPASAFTTYLTPAAA